MTRDGYNTLRDELTHLMNEERPEVVQIVSWAASNGDRSENGDYLYGKKRLREIDRRIRFLTKRLEMAEVVDPGKQPDRDRVFFGARCSIAMRWAKSFGSPLLALTKPSLCREKSAGFRRLPGRCSRLRKATRSHYARLQASNNWKCWKLFILMSK